MATLTTVAMVAILLDLATIGPPSAEAFSVDLNLNFTTTSNNDDVSRKNYGGSRRHYHYHYHHHKKSQSREFLEAHNEIRAQLREPPLIWDRKLARYARRWATTRAWDCKMIHSMGEYGENIFWGGQDHWTAREAVHSWVHERKHYDPNTNQCVPGHMCGHYTQVVWRRSRRVGCTRLRCYNGGVLMFCEYDPPGNYVNENPFGKLFEQSQ